MALFTITFRVQSSETGSWQRHSMLSSTAMRLQTFSDLQYVKCMIKCLVCALCTSCIFYISTIVMQVNLMCVLFCCKPAEGIIASLPPSFPQTRTRHQLFNHLVEELAQSMDDVDCPSLARDLVRWSHVSHRLITDGHMIVTWLIISLRQSL